MTRRFEARFPPPTGDRFDPRINLDHLAGSPVDVWNGERSEPGRIIEAHIEDGDILATIEVPDGVLPQ